MEENKNLNNEVEIDEVEVEEIDITDKKDLKKQKKAKTKKAPKKPKLIKNQALLKRGGYAMGITAAVLAGLIVFNVLIAVLAERVNLEFDMSLTAQNSMSEENIDFVKNLDKEVNVTVCAKAEDYVGEYMNYYAQQYGVTETYTDYYKQTITLLDKYRDYNKKIKIDYVDTQSTEFTQITTKYSNQTINYGDIIVTCNDGGNERYKIIGYKDIYVLSEDDTYAAYGVTTSTVSANNIETALTSAISYVTSSKTKKVAFITGHSKTDYIESYRNLLKTNNYEIELISDTLITNISDEFDALFIVAPTTDFIDTELDAIAKFLDNDGKYEKGLVFFADAGAPYLPNLYEYLEEWGIGVGEGILFETNANNHIPNEPTTLGSYPVSEDKINNGISACITGYNVPIKALFEEEGTYKVTSLIETPESVVAAPVGTANNWNGADNYTKAAYSTVMQSERMTYDKDNVEINNYVFAFSSTEFIYSDYAEMAQISNKNIALAAAERAVGAEDTGISFVSKTIENESFSDSVTQSSSSLITIIFMIALPVGLLATSIYVYIRRKNS